MLSLSRVSSASGASSYYEQEDNYYFLGEATTAWFGKGAESLGLSGAVNRDDFKHVLEGKLPNGESLEHMVNGENKHRPGYDLTFSAPKSVSVLALVVGDKAVLDAHNRAVKFALTEIEKSASTRIMKEGVVGIEQTNNITAALFMHDTNRNLEPALHTHAILSNITETKDGNWKTLSTDKSLESNAFIETIWKNPVAFGSLYRQHLKPDLEGLGYTLIEAGKYGQFEIKGVPTELFSSRGKEIIDAVGKDATAKQKSVAAKDTRKKKDFTNIEEVRESWKKQLSETGFDPEKIKSHEKVISKKDNDIDIKAVVKQVIKNLEKNNAKFTHDKLLSQVINSIGIERFESINSLRDVIKDEIKEGYLVPLKSNGDLFTTLGHLKSETNVVKLVNQLSDEKIKLSSKDNSSLANYMVSNDSQFKSISITGNNEFLIKTLDSISQLANENGKNSVVIVPDNKTKRFISENMTGDTKVLSVSDVNSDKKQLLQNSIVSIYKSESIKLDSINDILNKAKNENSIVVAIDTKTRTNEGIFSDVLKKADVETFSFYESNKNKQIYFVSDVDKGDRLKIASKQYMTLSINNKDAIIQVHDNKTKQQVNNSIRGQLITHGLLSERSVNVRNEQQVFLSDENRNLRNTYKKGLILDDVKENKRFKIADVDKAKNALLLINDEGERSRLSIKDIDKNYNLIEEKNINLRIGEKVKTYQRVGNLKSNSEYTVSAIRKGNFLFGEKVYLEDKEGKTVSLNPKKTTSLDYNYSETFGSSLNSNRTVIAILNKNDVSSTTMNKIKKSGDSIIAITGMSKDSAESKIEKVDAGINHIPKNTGNIFDTISKINEMKKDTLSDFDKIIELSIDKSSGGNVFFNGAAVVMNATNLDSSLSLEKITDAINIRIENGHIIPITSTALTDNYVKRETFNNEINIVKRIFEGKNKATPISSDTSILDNNKSLTKGQRAASELLLTSKDSIIAIQGYAGVGKTTQFKTVAQAIQTTRPDITLRGLAPTHRAVSELKGAGIESQTIASFTQEMAVNESQANYKNTVFIIDESSMTGNKGLSQLLDSITGNGGRVILSGDKDQLKSFESGVPFKLTLERSAIDHVVMDEIVRQTPELKPAVEAIIQGKVQESISVIQKVSPNTVPRSNNSYAPDASVIDLKGKERNDKLEVITQDFVSRTLDARNDTFIITPLNSDRNAINEGIHDLLVQNRSLPSGVEIQTYERVNNQEYDIKTTQFWQSNIDNTVKISNNYFNIDNINKDGVITLTNLETRQEFAFSALEADPRNISVYRGRNIEVSVGDKMRMTVTDIEQNAFNNDVGVVKSIDKEHVTIDFSGREVTFDPKQHSGKHIDYAYAITSYSSQGASIPYVIVYDGSEDNKRNLAALDNTYVELSRSKEHVQLYVDDLEKWEKHIEYNTGERVTAHAKLNYSENQKANISLKEWNDSADISGKLAEKLPVSLQDIAKYSSKKQEILLPVHDEYGVQRGNYHIPVGIFSGTLDFELAHYKGADDGSIIVINKGDNELTPVVYEKTDIEQAINNDSTDSSIIIKLDEKDKNDTSQLELTKEEISLQEAIEEIIHSKDKTEINIPIDEKKERLMDNIIDTKEEISHGIDYINEPDSKESDKRIRHDEENIVRHHPEKESSKNMDINI
ncbi:MobF family relaxase [Providencia rettgeri]|uniref:MobF family relaxase n=1 Tax=Providencia rettgeri TaxID=587 RepID=UPI0024812146|nr:MobF family relaxase [Providencia rettgeri]